MQGATGKQSGRHGAALRAATAAGLLVKNLSSSAVMLMHLRIGGRDALYSFQVLLWVPVKCGTFVGLSVSTMVGLLKLLAWVPPSSVGILLPQ